MTHSKIQKMKFFVFLLIFLFAQVAICDENTRDKEHQPDPVPAVKQVGNNILQNATNKTDTSHDNHDPPAAKTKPDGKSSKPEEKKEQSTKAPVQNEEEHTSGINSDALRRGFYVFLCLGVLVIAYIVFRTFRINKSRTQMIRKYGVLTHRQDVEMRPLPLDEDDEDDTTIFDARNIPVHGRTEVQPSTA